MKNPINMLSLVSVILLLSLSCSFLTQASPSFTPLANPVTAISVGGTHVCALLQNGEILCWGDNSSGQLGDGTYTPQSVPVKVSNITDAIAIASGGEHTCAITKIDGVKCWGSNYYGQIGDGTKNMSNVPVNVIGLSNTIVSIATGFDHTCAITNEGSVKCWGKNLYGRLGDGSNSLSRKTPVDVVNLEDKVVSITASDQHTCALLANGGVQCWGSNTSSQLGIDVNRNLSKTPEYAIDLTSGVSSISAGCSKTCAIMNDGKLKCWGWMGSGYFLETPTDISSLDNVISIATGAGHICAVIQDGSVQCLGENTSGQLGNNSTSDSYSPVKVKGLNGDALSAAACFDFTCALMKTGEVKCWGDNTSGQLGNGTKISSSIPVNVLIYPQQ